MRRCLELAQNGLGTTYPNPLVGSVIVYHDQIIGEGWHQKAGCAHAEVNAVQSVSDKSLLQKATLYVSLEPCAHHGKTPPCADMIVDLGIPRVVIGTTDPNTLVAGRGIQKLKDHGIEVILGVLETECLELNKRFFTYHNKHRPYIILKWAQSADGFMAPDTRESQKPVWISNVYSRQLVHKWRSEEQAILVGAKTVLDDNPSLDVRDWTGIHPVRIVLDKNRSIPPDATIFKGNSKTICITEQENLHTIDHCIFENAIFDNSIVSTCNAILFKHQIQSVIIEGGAKTLSLFLESGQWDEARVFTGATLLENGLKAPEMELKPISTEIIANDKLLIYRNHD